MKKSIAIILILITIVFSNCGPAAEDRVKSDARNKIIQDSMVNTIKSRIDQPLQIINQTPQVQPPAVDTAKKK
ncbi:MAG: hypothetical protein SFY56_06105 [Bacteroidota bacterium]|nr:hypothetical protein [Bacteroidota bacterium]